MQHNKFRQLVFSETEQEQNILSAFTIPIESWSVMMREVEKTFKKQAIYLFIESLYVAALEEEKYDRPPKGMVIKHLGLWYLHWICTGESLEAYGGKGKYRTGVSTTYLRSCLSWIRKRLPYFNSLVFVLREPEEMNQLATEFFSNLGKITY